MSPPEPRNEAFGNFGLPDRPAPARGQVLAAAAVALFVFTLGSTATTGWLAHKLRYQAALGAPSLRVLESPLYAPWRLADWLPELASSSSGRALAETSLAALYFSGVLGLGAGALVHAIRKRRAGNKVRDLHGSARWAAREDIARAGLLDPAGVIVGAWPDRLAKRLRVLRSDGPEHVLFFAVTGSGKGVGCVLPTLLTWKHSALVLDIKGENHALTSGWRQSAGQNVYKFDPGAPGAGASARFNFLATVRLGTRREVADAQRLARALVDPNGELLRASSNGSNHWLATAIGLLTAAILHVLYREHAAGHPMPSLTDVLDELATDTKTFTELLLDWLSFGHDPRLVQGWTDSENLPTQTHKIVRTVASLQLKKDEKERNAILSSTVTALDVFQDPVLVANTSRSDFCIEDLMDAERPTTVYLVLRPDDLKRLGTLSRVFLEIALRRLMAGMEFLDGRQHGTHRHRLLLLLDEFTSLGRLDIVAESIAYMRGYGIKALLIIQNLVQLRKEYGRDEPISVNCALCGAYAPSKVDVETAKTLSAMTGTTTILRKSTSRTLSFGFLTSKGSSQTESEVSRPLLTPDECTQLPTAVKHGSDIVSPGHMLAFAAGAPAIYGEQFLFFRDPELLRRSRIPAASARPDPGSDPAAALPGGSWADHAGPSGHDARSTQPTDSSGISPPSDDDSVAQADFELDDELMRLALDDGSDGEESLDG